jgi:hypothetical protein
MSLKGMKELVADIWFIKDYLLLMAPYVAQT